MVWRDWRQKKSALFFFRAFCVSN